MHPDPLINSIVCAIHGTPAGFDWKVLGPDVPLNKPQYMDFVAWMCDQDAYACAGGLGWRGGSIYLERRWPWRLMAFRWVPLFRSLARGTFISHTTFTSIAATALLHCRPEVLRAVHHVRAHQLGAGRPAGEDQGARWCVEASIEHLY